jgi:tetratricopeptide repeat protein
MPEEGSAADGGAASGRDVNISASLGGVGPGLIQGDKTAIGQMVYPPAEAEGRPAHLLPKPEFLAGREELLTELDGRLTGGEGHGPRFVALSGLGGAGKTSVALAYAYSHLNEVEVVWQFAAEDATVLSDEFGKLAAELGTRDLSVRDPVASVHSELARRAAGWLLIFDNAADMASAEKFLPPAGPGRVLITSQNPDWPWPPLDVPPLGDEVAARFLISRTGDQDWQAALELARQMGGLPLALEQAAAYMVAVGDSLAYYLTLFQRRRADLLRSGLTGHGPTVTTTWALALGRLESDFGAAALLRLVAFCAPEAIPLRLLLQPRPGLEERLGPQVAPVLTPLLADPLAVNHAVVALRRYSLVTTAPGKLVSVHRLVQAVTADHMPAEQAAAWQQATAAVIEAAIPRDPQPPDTWPDFAALLPHAQAALDAGSDGIVQIASYLGYSGNYVAARDLMRGVVDARESAEGAEHPSTLIARSNLAHWSGEAGNAIAACDQLAALMPVEERVLGPEHPQTLATRDSLARWTGQAGDAAAARTQLAALLPVKERVLGPENPSTLITRGNLAYWTGAAGDTEAAAAARDQFAALLPIRERVLGAQHPRTLSDRDWLARFTGDAGNPAAARDQLAALLPVKERVLGPENPSTLITRGNLAYWTAAAGDLGPARDQFAALVPLREQVLGAEHSDTLVARDDLARFTGEAGDAETARDQFAALLTDVERIFGPQHRETLTKRGSLAYWTGAAGDKKTGRDQYAALLPLEERLLGTEDPQTLATRDNLARFTGDAGDPETARDQFAALLTDVERIFGPQSRETLTTRGSLAYWTGEAGDKKTAREQYARLLPLEEELLGTDDPQTLATRNNLARFTGDAGDATPAPDG